MAAGTLCEYLEDQQCPIVDGQTKLALQVALLSRAERLVKKHLAGARGLGQHFYFFCFPGTHKQRRIGRSALAADPFSHLESCGLRKQAQLFKTAVKMRAAQVNTHQNH